MIITILLFRGAHVIFIISRSLHPFDVDLYLSKLKGRSFLVFELLTFIKVEIIMGKKTHLAGHNNKSWDVGVHTLSVTWHLFTFS